MSTTPPTPSRGFGFATLGTLSHAAFLLALFAILVLFVPSAKKTFDEYGLALPWLTQTVIRVSNWVAEYWWSLVPLFLLLGAGDFGLTAALNAHSRFVMVLWHLAVTLVLMASIAVVLFSIELPWMKLREGLAR